MSVYPLWETENRMGEIGTTGIQGQEKEKGNEVKMTDRFELNSLPVHTHKHTVQH